MPGRVTNPEVSHYIWIYTNLLVRYFSRNGVSFKGTRIANLYRSVGITSTPPGEKIASGSSGSAAEEWGIMKKKMKKKRVPARLKHLTLVSAGGHSIHQATEPMCWACPKGKELLLLLFFPLGGTKKVIINLCQRAGEIIACTLAK